VAAAEFSGVRVRPAFGIIIVHLLLIDKVVVVVVFVVVTVAIQLKSRISLQNAKECSQGHLTCL